MGRKDSIVLGARMESHSGGHFHCPTAATQNCGNSLGSRPSVRISDTYLRDNSGSALKALIEADESALEGSQIRTRARSVEAMQPTTMPMRQINLFPSTEQVPFDTYDTYEYARSSSPPQGEYLGIPISTERMPQGHSSGRWTPDGFDACVGNARSAPAACWSDLAPPSHDNNRDRCITPPDAAHTRVEHPWSRVTDCYETPPAATLSAPRTRPRTRPRSGSRVEVLRHKKHEYYEGSVAHNALYGSEREVQECWADAPYTEPYTEPQHAKDFHRPQTSAEILLDNNFEKTQSGNLYTVQDFFDDVRNAQLGTSPGVVADSQAQTDFGRFADAGKQWGAPEGHRQNLKHQNLVGNGDIISWASPG